MQAINAWWRRASQSRAARGHPILAAVLLGCLTADLAVAVLCPVFGGDCIYGFFSLIVFPVMLSGPAGLIVPRHTARWSMVLPRGLRAMAGGRAGEGLVWLCGALVLGLVITLAHMAAIVFFNWFDYGGVLIRARLLQVELGLAAIYYVALGAIAYAAAPLRQR